MHESAQKLTVVPARSSATATFVPVPGVVVVPGGLHSHTLLAQAWLVGHPPQSTTSHPFDIIPQCDAHVVVGTQASEALPPSAPAAPELDPEVDVEPPPGPELVELDPEPIWNGLSKSRIWAHPQKPTPTTGATTKCPIRGFIVARPPPL